MPFSFKQIVCAEALHHRVLQRGREEVLPFLERTAATLLMPVVVLGLWRNVKTIGSKGIVYKSYDETEVLSTAR